MHNRRHGFSLLELTLVIVIIGLLVGGILIGQTMKRASQVRSVLSDALTYAVAIQNFQAKYGALPGDMSDATRIWGRADGNTSVNSNCTTPNSAVSVGKPTCNGDGNGIISDTSTIVESFRAWQQLAAAGLITGSFTGVAGSGGSKHAQFVGASINAPAGALTNTGFYIASYGAVDSVSPPGATEVTSYFDGDYNNTLLFGLAANNSYPNGAGMIPTDAFGIDTKVDDGFPGLGTVRSYKPAVLANCATSSTASTALYNTSYTKAGCALLFTNAFKAKQ